MAVFSVDSDAVLATTSAVRGTIDRLQGETSAMMSQLMQLQASWTGSASIASARTTSSDDSSPGGRKGPPLHTPARTCRSAGAAA